MNPKPGIWTTEHLAAIVSQVLTVLALFGFISQNDTHTLEEAATKAAAAAFIFVANALVVINYIRSRLHIKTNGNGHGNGNGNGNGKTIAGGLLLLVFPLIFGGAAQAQYLLPFRNNHEQRLKQLEQKGPQQAPQIHIFQAPAQPPLQSFPIQGQPQQSFPIQGQPKQDFPIQGAPKQDLPIPGAPRQDLPVPGAPRQDFPIQAPAPKAPNAGPVPYSRSWITALYRN